MSKTSDRLDFEGMESLPKSIKSRINHSNLANIINHHENRTQSHVKALAEVAIELIGILESFLIGLLVFVTE